MNTSVKRALSCALAAGLIAAAIGISVWALSGAQAQVVTTLAIDMDPKDGGASYTNDDHTVGNIDPCIEVSAGDTLELDVVLDAIPTGVGASDLGAYQLFMGFDSTNLTFSNQLKPPAGSSPGADGIHMIVRAPNACSGLLGCIISYEAVPEPPDSGSPASPGVHDVFVVDGSGSWVGSGTDPYGKAGGVLARFEITVSGTAPSGLYGIGLNDSASYVAKVNDSTAAPIWDLPGNGVDNDSDGTVDEDLMLDRTYSPQYGLIAVDDTCPTAPTPTPTPTPTAPVGFLRVVSDPPVVTTISANGVIRNDWGLAWTEMPPDTYTVSFSDVPGFLTPADQVVTVTSGAVTEVTGVFSPAAYLRVVTVGAFSPETPTIYLDGVPMSTWGIWVGLPPGSYTVSFEDIPGLTKPCDRPVTLTGGTGTKVEGDYTDGSCDIVPYP